MRVLMFICLYGVARCSFAAECEHQRPHAAVKRWALVELEAPFEGLSSLFSCSFGVRGWQQLVCCCCLFWVFGASAVLQRLAGNMMMKVTNMKSQLPEHLQPARGTMQRAYDPCVVLLSLQVMFYEAHVPLGAVAEGFLKPSIPRPAIGQAVALVGSLIMPHNIYLHSALVQVRSNMVKPVESWSNWSK